MKMPLNSATKKGHLFDDMDNAHALSQITNTPVRTRNQIKLEAMAYGTGNLPPRGASTTLSLVSPCDQPYKRSRLAPNLFDFKETMNGPSNMFGGLGSLHGNNQGIGQHSVHNLQTPRGNATGISPFSNVSRM